MFSEALVANLSRGTQASEHALYSNIQIQRLQNYLLKESDQERCMRTMYDVSSDSISSNPPDPPLDLSPLSLLSLSLRLEHFLHSEKSVADRGSVTS